MEKQAQEIGQFLYKRGRAGGGGSSGRKQEKDWQKKTDGVAYVTLLSLLFSFFRRADMSDCQEFPLIIKGSESSEEKVTLQKLWLSGCGGMYIKCKLLFITYMGHIYHTFVNLWEYLHKIFTSKDALVWILKIVMNLHNSPPSNVMRYLGQSRPPCITLWIKNSMTSI